jgi:acyl-CoA hydrolase
MTEYIATEYGVAKLAGLSLGERAKAMISVAHPQFREELERYAQEHFR